jgi:hypothetical protein
MSWMLATSALGLGFVHGLGADHLMAIAALAVRRRDRTAGSVWRTAVGFAIGHALVLGAAVAAAVGLGVVVPAAFSGGAERVGGAMLVALGLIAAWGLATGRAYGHLHTETDGRFRWHLHMGWFGGHPHAHSRVPALLGAAFAMSSVRALMLFEPIGGTAASLSWPATFVLLMLFGVGILASMALFGVILARVLSLGVVETLGRVAAGVVAAASIALGAYWMWA